ncbi:DUF349 domain-containing protein [Sinosporangium siamense]|uniref:DUF349 domain-containing protein n=1 Tax=Sinosporangium siamense TaxID=1367973 RepID=UPI00194E8341|nr:DUF349 domain-containing protein [Sinosporangium siamense]
MSTDPWGRVDDDGTVYVRTAEGERAVGSWQAGEPEEALAYYRRKYAELATQVELLEQRVRGTDLPPAQAEAGIVKLRDAVAEAKAVGDLAALMGRLTALTDLVGQRREEVKAARDHARAEAKGVKERIVAEAERIAEDTTHWKSGGERLRQLVEEWKAAERIDRATEATLWKRLSSARTAFAKRRKAYFAGLDEQREGVRAAKERIVAEAEALADSTDWSNTASVYRELMRQWKSAGRASREAEDELWTRFKSAQDQFFQARSAVYAERDASLAANAEIKEQLLIEAEKIVPVTDARAARATLRGILERWEAAGPVPRDMRDRLEGGLRRVDEAVRRGEEAEWKRSNPEARARAQDTVNQLRRSIEQLEGRLAKATAAGRDKDVKEAEEALAARRSWLEEAERTLAEFS